MLRPELALRLIVVTLALGASCSKKQEPPAPASPRAAAPAEAAAAAAAAVADQEPEPVVHPCKNCSVDVLRKVSGTWQDATCLPANTDPVAYPASLAVVEVTAGNQQGMTFAVTSSPSSFEVDAAFEGTLPVEAKPDTWSAAKLLITDANGKSCSSVLAILR